MKKANLVLIAALAAAGVGIVGGSLLPVPAFAAAAKKQSISSAVLKPLKAAQDAMNAKNWDEAQARIQEAQAVEGKTPYDAFMVDELGWFILLQKKDYAGSAATLERALGSGFVTEADVPQRVRAFDSVSTGVGTPRRAA